jgi:hypothetical protein
VSNPVIAEEGRACLRHPRSLLAGTTSVLARVGGQLLLYSPGEYPSAGAVTGQAVGTFS